ncbi:hypothetical protein chiPu_0026209, partial [Chiloscyllium punctatum]|nr:hypothetical protein [Chiloscyllium punctatum]
PTPTVHWHRLDGDLPRDRVSYDNFNKTLKIHDVIEDDDGEYRCVVRNGQGQVQHTYHVSVEAAPYWVKKPEDGVYGPGENVRLDCDVEAKPEARIHWRVNGVLLSGESVLWGWGGRWGGGGGRTALWGTRRVRLLHSVGL